MSASQNTPPQWTEEFCYFGNSIWPSSVTYRRAGQTVQVRAELPLSLREVVTERTGLRRYHHSEPCELRDFLASYRDCELIVNPGYIATNDGGELVPPSMYAIGWKDITTSEEIAQYERDKMDGMKKPS